MSFAVRREILENSFFERSSLTVARALIGCYLVHESNGRQRRGRIVETEAYVGFRDAASHAHRGKTKRNAPMFGPAGYAYVYLIYGVHYCLNVVTDREGFPGAVLIRALEPQGDLTACNGPGRLTRALGVDLRHNNIPLSGPPLYLAPRQHRPARIVVTPRIGVAYAGCWADKLWRFVDAHSPHLSRSLQQFSNKGKQGSRK